MGLSVDVLDRMDAFEAVRGEWDRAVAASADASIFLTWGWLRCCWEHFASRRDGARLHVVLVRAGDELVAGLPLAQVRIGVGPRPGRATVLEPLTHRSGDYGGAVLVRPHDDAVDALLAHLAAQLRQGIAGVTVSRLRSDGVFLARLRGRAAAGDAAVAASEAVLDGVWSYADVRQGYDLARYLKRHKIRQRLGRLTARHEVSFQYYTGANLDEGIDRLLHTFRRRWMESGDRGWRPSFLTDRNQRAHLLDTVRAADEGGWLRLLGLTADGRTVACELGLDYGGTHHLFRGSFDPDFAEFSPGHLMHYRVFDDGLARGVSEFDFMRGTQDYKRRWSTDEREVVTVTLTKPGKIGRLGALRLRAIRSAAARVGG